MRKAPTILLLVISVAAFGYQAVSQWTKYTSTEGRYSVLLPSEPQLKSQEETAPDGGKIEQHLAFATDSAGAGYMVAYFETGDRSFSFDKARDGAISRVNGTLISERDIKLHEYPGREVKLFGAAGGEDFFFVVRFYRVEKRVFVIQFIVPKSAGQELPDKAIKFFDSFQMESK
jgi:hypothetical protein